MPKRFYFAPALSKELCLPANHHISFIDTLDAVGGDLPGNFSFRPSTIQNLQSAGISQLLLSNTYIESSNWAKMGNQRLEYKDEQGSLTAFGMQYQQSWMQMLK